MGSHSFNLQVLSSENWTDVMYTAAEAEVPLGQSALIALFFSIWFLFANCKFYPTVPSSEQ